MGAGWRYDVGWGMATVVYVPLAIWAADLFTRAVDKPSVELAKWVEGKCFRRRGGGERRA